MVYNYLLIYIVVILCTILLIIVYKKKYFSFTAYEVFLIFSIIYAVFVPIDHLFGFHIREHEVFINLNNSKHTLNIIKVALCYSVFFFSASFVYIILSLYCKNNIIRPEYERFIPSVKFIIMFNVVLCCMYIIIDYSIISKYTHLGGSLKQVRNNFGLLYNYNYRVFSALYNFIVVFNYIIIILGKDFKKTSVSVFSIVLLSLYMGDRSTLFIPVFVACLVHKPRLNKIYLSFIPFIIIVFFVFFKPTYNYIVETSQGYNRSLISYYKNVNFSLSRVETLSPFEVTDYIINNKDNKYLFGATYFNRTLFTFLPKSIYRSKKVKTLAVEYKNKLVPNKKGFFGFSAIGEMIINFGYFGLVVVGILMGFYLSFLRRMKEGIIYYVNIMMIIRFYRTDFASLFKRYIVVDGTLIIVSICMLFFIYNFKKIILIGKNDKNNLIV